MKYQTCIHCGAHLDHGENCDCQVKQRKPVGNGLDHSEKNNAKKEIRTIKLGA